MAESLSPFCLLYTMSDQNPSDVKIPTEAKAAEELALENDEEEPGVTEEQRRNIAFMCAKLIGDID
jgi:hypothetical protein